MKLYLLTQNVKLFELSSYNSDPQFRCENRAPAKLKEINYVMKRVKSFI